MATRWHDVSIALHDGIAVWPGDPPYRLEALSRKKDGNSCNVSSVHMTTHTGTHVDAPWHFEEDGKRLDEVDPQLFFGEALLLDMGEVPLITEEHLGSRPLPPRVLFKTMNSTRSCDVSFFEDFVALDASAAQRLVDAGVRLVGVDYLSIAPFNASEQTHHILLQNEVLIVEGLRLTGFPSGMYPFIVLPLPLADADGAPCRAFLGAEEKTT